MANLKITDVRVHPGDSGFLIDDGHTAILYDSGFGFTGFAMAQNIKAALGDRPLDYIFLTHSHYDHALGSAYIREAFPEAKVVAGEYAVGIFQKPSARRVMGELDQKFAAMQGVTGYEDLSGALTVDIPVADGDEIRAGSLRFTAVSLPGHTRCSVGYYLQENRLLLGCETLGVYGGGETVVPAYLVGYEMTLRSMEKAAKLDVETILAPHWGLLSPVETARYLKNGRERTVEFAGKIVELLRSGGTREDAAELFRQTFYHGYIRDIYPPDAMNLNTGIMIGLIEKELC